MNHASLAPIHEMIGLVERKLGEWERSRLHLAAALEISQAVLRGLEEEGGRRGPDADGGGGPGGSPGDGRAGSFPSEASVDKRRILQIGIERLQKMKSLVDNLASAKEAEGLGHIQEISVEASEDLTAGSPGSREGVGPVGAAGPEPPEKRMGAVAITNMETGMTQGGDKQSDGTGVGEAEKGHRVSISNMEVLLSEEEDGRSDGVGMTEEDHDDEDGVYTAGGEEEETEKEERVHQRHERPSLVSMISQLTEDSGEDELSDTSLGDSIGIHQTFFSLMAESEMPTIAELRSESSESLCQDLSDRTLSDQGVAAPPGTDAGDRGGSPAPPAPPRTAPRAPDREGNGGRPRPPPARLGSAWTNTSDPASLRARVREHSAEGEQLYELEQYAMAVACFNEAKFSLLILKGQAEGPEEGRTAGLVKFRDRINSVSGTLTASCGVAKPAVSAPLTANFRFMTGFLTIKNLIIIPERDELRCCCCIAFPLPYLFSTSSCSGLFCCLLSSVLCRLVAFGRLSFRPLASGTSNVIH